MTFSLVARDPASGALGMVVSSSSPAVASRCVHLRTHVGAVASQNVTQPALGTAVLDALSKGMDAPTALEAALEREAFPDVRQVTVVDRHGKMAVHSGRRALGIHTHSTGREAVSAGNMLATDQVTARMLAAYEDSDAPTFEERLLAGLLGALAEGGEAGPVRSAGIAVVDDVPWQTTDLRVDDHDAPIAELARLVALWLPQKADYRTRALTPDAAPSYGVAGDR